MYSVQATRLGKANQAEKYSLASIRDVQVDCAHGCDDYEWDSMTRRQHSGIVGTNLSLVINYTPTALLRHHAHFVGRVAVASNPVSTNSYPRGASAQHSCTLTTPL